MARMEDKILLTGLGDTAPDLQAKRKMPLDLLPSDLPLLQTYTSHIVKFLEQYQWLIDAFVLDFFLKNHWSLVPPKWRESFEDIEVSQIADFLDGKPEKLNKVSPLSLLCFNRLCKTLPFSRKSVLPSRKLEEEINNFAWEDTKYPLTSGFKRHMKGKKRHEVCRLAKLANDSFESVNIDHVLDVGGGQGHLSRLLCFGYGLNVATLDAVGDLVDKAAEFDTKVTKDLGKEKYQLYKGTPVFQPPVHLERRIGVSTAEEDVLFVARNAWNEDSMKFGLIGLHTCGDLGPTMVKLFGESSQIKCLVSVGCCYHKIHHLYPLSQTLSEHRLSYEAKEVACHSIEVYTNRLREDDFEKGRVHSFRAALEVLIDRYHPELKHTSLRSVKYTPGLTFAEYAPKALRKTEHNIPESEFNSDEINGYMNRWKQVATLFALRLCIAPVIETLLLLDRIMYLLEKGNNVQFVPLFEPTVSPRCNAIVATRIADENLEPPS